MKVKSEQSVMYEKIFWAPERFDVYDVLYEVLSKYLSVHVSRTYERVSTGRDRPPADICSPSERYGTGSRRQHKPAA